MPSRTEAFCPTPAGAPRGALQGACLLGAASLAFACVALDNTKLALAWPTIARELAASAEARVDVGWIVEVNLFVYASLLLLGGALSERLGARRALLLGLSLFALASVAAALARSTLGLVVARALVGVGAALMTPASLATLRHGFAGPRRARAVAVWTASFGGAAALGPLLGGLLLERWGWRAVLLANVPLATLAALGVRSQVSRTLPRCEAPLDLPGALLGLSGAAGLMSAATFARVDRAGAAAAAAAGALSYGLLWAWQRRARHPLLEPELLAAPAFRGALLISALGYFAYAGLSFAVVFDLQVARAHSPSSASVANLPLPLGLLGGTLLGPWLRERFGARRALRGSLALALVGAGAIALGAGGGGGLGLALLPFALGTGSAFPTVTELVLAAAAPERAGSAAAVSESAFELGGALGVALLGVTSPLGSDAWGSLRGGPAALGAALALGLALVASTGLARAPGC